MIKSICNSELFVSEKSKKTRLVLTIFIGAVLLPLSAIGVVDNHKAPIKDTYAVNIADESTFKSEEGTTEVNNELLDSNGAMSSNDANTAPHAANINIPDPSIVNTTTIANEPSDKNVINNGTSSNNAAASTAALDNIDGLNSDNTEEKLAEKQPETAKKAPFWKNTDYVLPGGLIFLILGGALLSFLKISRLGDENEKLEQQNQRLRKEAGNAINKLKQSNIKNAELESTLKQQLNINNDYKSNAIDTFGAVLPIMDTEEPLVIEDLNASDRNQLSDSITTWFKTNRGNTEVRELVPNDIQKKLDHLSYKIELWVGSDGVDSVELASNTMRAAVISLTKPDRQGFAYCYKKPNSLSNIWANKAWYKAQRTERTLEVIGKPLESN